MPEGTVSRRQFLAGWGAAALGLGLGRLAPAAPTATVALASCRTYGAELVPTLDRMFDQIGGLGRLVKGKTVAMKLNLTGLPNSRLGTRPIGLAQWVHPDVIGAVVHLMDRAGAHRIRLLESPWATTMPVEEYMYQAGWEVAELTRAGRRVEYENTNWLGRGKDYVRFDVPGGGLLFPAYLLNHSYTDCDTFVSLAKLKDHLTTGITLSMKNCFGNIPTTIYGDTVPEDEPDDVPRSGRGAVFHRGTRQPSGVAPPELHPDSPRHGGYRLPRVVVDICAARPIDLAIVDGIESMAAAEGPWGGGTPCSPGVLVAGTNCVNTDAVAAAVMGYDPMAKPGTVPFDNCHSFLELAERQGLGTRDLARIEVAGAAIEDVRFPFLPLRPSRHPDQVVPFPELTTSSS